MKNLKEIKLMMERLESPRLTETELNYKKSLLKEEIGKRDPEEGEQLVNDKNSLEGGSLEDFKLPSSDKKMYKYLNDGWLAWSDENGKVFFRKNPKPGIDERWILDYFNSKGFTYSNQFNPDIPENIKNSEPDYRRK
jgi:hypothetical protein